MALNDSELKTEEYVSDGSIEALANNIRSVYQNATSRMFNSQPFDHTDPDLYADNGFNIWGYDSLQYAVIDNRPATQLTRFLYATSGTNMARENWQEFIRRKLNEFIPDVENALTMEDELPTFYNHIPEAVIVD